MSDLTLNEISPARLNDRKSLLASFDHFRRDVDNSGLVEGLDTFHQQAFAMLTSSRLAEALDLNKEDQKLRDRYGRGFPNLKDDGSHRLLDDFLMARRLVEAGVRKNYYENTEDAIVMWCNDLRSADHLESLRVLCPEAVR